MSQHHLRPGGTLLCWRHAWRKGKVVIKPNLNVVARLWDSVGIASFYDPPSHTDIEWFENLLNAFSGLDVPVYLVGDCNWVKKE